MKKMFRLLGGKWLVVFLSCCLGLVAPAFGEDLQFLVTWSGAGLGNGASAMGIIAIDDTALLNPGDNNTLVNPFVVDFRMRVSGAPAGNGSFGRADFDQIFLRTGPGNPGDLPLDFGQELFGQNTGTDPWGTQSLGGGGDFNMSSASPGIPDGLQEFVVCANDGAGDCMELTSFRPVHTAWLKVKLQTKGLQFTGTTLLGKAKAKGTCYWYLRWHDLDPAGGTIYCETTPGDWMPIGGAGVMAWDAKSQLVAGSCGLTTAAGAVAGPGFFTWSWKTEMDGALKSAKVRTVGGYLTGTLDGVNSYYGDCRMTGSKVSESRVPPEVVALTP